MGPLEVDAHVELGVGGAVELQALACGQPLVRRGQGEVVDLVSCGTGSGRGARQ